jgi:hypothetical protein
VDETGLAAADPLRLELPDVAVGRSMLAHGQPSRWAV